MKAACDTFVGEALLHAGGQTVHNAELLSYLRSDKSVIYQWPTSNSERSKLWRIPMFWA